MAYCTQDEVAADFKDIDFTESGANVTASDVTQFIVEADSLIDSYIGQRYIVPVTAGAGLDLLKYYSRSIVADRVRGILEVKQVNTTDANQKPRRNLDLATVIKELEKIRNGVVSLLGATPILAQGEFFSSNYSNDVEPVFKKSERQW